MKENLGRVARRVLARPNSHFALAFIGSVYSIYSRKGWTPIYKDGDIWIHKCPDGYIVERYVNFTATLSLYRVQANDYWCAFYKPQPGDIVLDIGAGIGTEAAYFSSEIGNSGIMISVEAHPATYSALDLFCHLNNFTNVQRLQVAIHNSDQSVLIDNIDNHVGSSILDTKQGILVQGMTIDNLVEKYGLSKIDFMKMNIEGAEQYALDGMRHALHITRQMCIACHDFKAERTGKNLYRTKEMVRLFLEEQGFEILERGYDSRPWIRDHVYARNRSL